MSELPKETKNIENEVKTIKTIVRNTVKVNDVITAEIMSKLPKTMLKLIRNRKVLRPPLLEKINFIDN